MLKILQMKLLPALTGRLGTVGFAVRIAITGNYVIRSLYRVLVGKPEGKRPIGRPRRKWEDNIKVNLQQVGCGVMDWIELTQDRDRWRALVNVVVNLRVP